MSAAAVLATHFAVNDLFGGSVTDAFTDEIWSEPVAEDVNHPAWVLCHLIEVRRSIARNLGADVPESDSIAGFGSERLAADQYPAPAELVAEFASLGRRITAGLGRATEVDLAATYEPNFPDGNERTLAEALPFLAAHEAMHIGQISLMRRLHALPGIADVVLARMAAMQNG